MTETLTTAHAALLGRVDLFGTLDRIALARLAACAEPLEFTVDQDVCREGDSADGIYVVVRGTFAVLSRDPSTGRHGRIGALGPGRGGSAPIARAALRRAQGVLAVARDQRG